MTASGTEREELSVSLPIKSAVGLIVAAQLGAPSPLPPELHEGLRALQDAVDRAASQEHPS
jgi:hypothetical protein